jgi:hypothetical protein
MNFASLRNGPVHPAIAEAACYFEQLAPGDALPRRHDFRPNRVPHLLGYYFLIDVADDGRDYRFSLAGEHMSLLFGSDITNRYLSELGDEDLCTRLRKTYDTVVATRTFHYLRGRYAWPERWIVIERLLVPMTDHDGHLNTIIGLSIPDTHIDDLNLIADVGAAKLEVDSLILG